MSIFCGRSLCNQVLSHVVRPMCIIAAAAWHGARRRLTSPVISPETSRSPDWFYEGVWPTQGPTFFGDRPSHRSIHLMPLSQKPAPPLSGVGRK